MFRFDPFNEGPDFDVEKMRQCILYFVQNGDPDTLGKTKLMKLLYYADFDHYERFDESITGATYRKLPAGPVPKAAFEMLDQMVRENVLSVEQVPTPSFVRNKYEALESFDRSLFTDEELETLETVSQRWRTVKTNDIVAASHDDPPWIAVASGSEIPYHLVYYRNTYGEMELEEDERTGHEDEIPSEDEYFDGISLSAIAE